MEKDAHAPHLLQGLAPAVAGIAGLLPHEAMLAAMGGSRSMAAPEELPLSPARLRLEREQDLFNELYLLAPVGYLLLALDSVILQSNVLGSSLLGLARGAPGRHYFRDYVLPRFHADFACFMRHALNSEQPQRCQLKLRGRPGTAECAVTLVGSGAAGGQALRVVLELAEGRLPALQQSEERFRRIVHMAREGIWEIDAHARTSFVNPRMAAMLGYRIEEMLDQPLVRFMDREGRSILERNIARRQQGLAERHEFKFLRKDGGELWASLDTNPIFDAHGVYLGALALVNELDSQGLPAGMAWQQTSFDALTGLPNRHILYDRLAQEMKKCRREQQYLALLYIDLDQFRLINEQLGRAQGDALLAEAAVRLGAAMRASDTLARTGGDEFTAVVGGLDDIALAERIAQHLLGALHQPFLLPGGKAMASASIGIALYPSDAADPEDLLRQAEQAMYAAKNAGRHRYSYFTDSMQAAAQQRLRLAAELRRAVAQQEFELYYQPIVQLSTGQVARAEALLRWRHPQRGLLAPADFIGHAETAGLMGEISDWAFRAAALQVQRWQRELGRPFQVSVNHSPSLLRGGRDCCEEWRAFLSGLDLPPRSIVLDIGEALLGEAGPALLAQLRSFHAMGLQVALDDFGTGQAALLDLSHAEIDFLKLDGSLVAGLPDDASRRAMCEGIVALAHKLGLEVVAEGVENMQQLAALKAGACDYAQGYLLAAPLQASDMVALARRGRGLSAG
jgi:diguanylate cyclase (GGDEF)-like protein/PAS domain S-box-containing protein